MSQLCKIPQEVLCRNISDDIPFYI